MTDKGPSASKHPGFGENSLMSTQVHLSAQLK